MIWLLFVAALTLRLALTLTHEGYLGVDGGAYLHGLNVLLGGEEYGAGFPRPPLAPGFLLFPFTSALGVDVGYKVWSAVASLAPAIPVYLLARRIMTPELGLPALLPALFAVGFLFLDPLHAEMIVTGALPLIGFGLLGMVWWAMGSLADRWSWRDAVILAGCLGLIPFVNQTTAGLAIVTIPVYLIALLWYNRKVTIIHISLWRIAPPVVVGGAIALGALPWYLDVLPVTGLLNYPGAFIYLTHPFDSAWWQLLLAWPLGIWMIRKGEAPWLRSLGVLVCLLGTLLVFLSTDETIINVFYRSRYLLALPFYVGISWLICTRWLPYGSEKGRKAALWLSGAAAAVLMVGYVSQFDRQTGYSDMATPATVIALQQIPPGAGVVNNSFTLALWITALNKAPSPHIWTWAPPPSFVETDKDVRCILGWVPSCAPTLAKNRLGVEYVLIDSRFPDYNERAPSIYKAPPEQWAVTAQTPWLTQVFQEDTTTMWRIDVP